MAPRFPFGFGLSYSRFGYSADAPMVPPAVPLGAGADVRLIVTNLGARDGTEVAQARPRPARPPALPRCARCSAWACPLRSAT